MKDIMSVVIRPDLGGSGAPAPMPDVYIAPYPSSRVRRAVPITDYIPDSHFPPGAWSVFFLYMCVRARVCGFRRGRAGRTETGDMRYSTL